MAYLLLYIALTWLVLMPARFRAMAKGYRKASLALKALPTALAAAFAAAGYFSAEVRDLYGLMIFIGLCVCTLADVALDVRFEVGGALFFTGHVVYVAALSQYRMLSWWCLTVFVIALAGLWCFALRYRRHFPKPHLLAGVMIYVVALAALLAFSLPLPLLAPSGPFHAGGAGGRDVRRFGHDALS